MKDLIYPDWTLDGKIQTKKTLLVILKLSQISDWTISPKNDHKVFPIMPSEIPPTFSTSLFKL